MLTIYTELSGSLAIELSEIKLELFSGGTGGWFVPLLSHWEGNCCPKPPFKMKNVITDSNSQGN